jgi:hypothetical protein
MRSVRLTGLSLALSFMLFLTGCPEFFEALALAASQPKIVYLVNTADPAAPVVRFAAIQPTDFAFLTGTITDFEAPGRVVSLRLSPGEDYAAITHIEEAGVIEARVMVYTNTGLREAFETDNTVSADIEAFCGAESETVSYGYEILPELFPPDDPKAGDVIPEARFSDSPNNEISLVDWIDTDSLLMQLSIELRLIYVASDGSEIDFGILRDETFFLTYARNTDATWSGVACDYEIPAGTGGFVTTRDVSLSDSVGGVSTILLDGVPLLDVNGNPISPGGALLVDGPYR